MGNIFGEALTITHSHENIILFLHLAIDSKYNRKSHFKHSHVFVLDRKKKKAKEDQKESAFEWKVTGKSPGASNRQEVTAQSHFGSNLGPLQACP